MHTPRCSTYHFELEPCLHLAADIADLGHQLLHVVELSGRKEEAFLGIPALGGPLLVLCAFLNATTRDTHRAFLNATTRDTHRE